MNYYITTNIGTRVKVDGMAVPNTYGLHVFTYKDNEGQFMVSEAQTGFRMSQPHTRRADAVKEFHENVSKHGLDNVKKLLQDALQHPMYKKATEGKKPARKTKTKAGE
jgi:hypothetical protein